MVATAIPLTIEKMDALRKQFYEEPCNVIAQNACTQISATQLLISRPRSENAPHVFSHKVDIQTKPVSNQKGSGRCWIFACLNVIRHAFMKQFNLDEFEFSQSFLFFWDKLERCNFFLNNMVEVFGKGEEVEGRLVSFLLSDPICDGGQWDMLVNLVLKYGLMPKSCFTESASSESSYVLNKLLRSKLREYARDLKSLVAAKSSEEVLKGKIAEQMDSLYKIIAIHLGIPPKTFTWEYYDKDSKYFRVGPMTPLEFYEKLVKPIYNINEKVCIVNDPRPKNSYNKAYTVAYLGNMVGGRKTVYNNQPVERLIELSKKCIQDGEPVWFGCEMGKYYHDKTALLDLEMFDLKSLYNVERTSLNKAERLEYGDSSMTHAMIITAVTLDDESTPTRWRVENSWGEDFGKKGFLMMTTEWFREFTFEVIVDKKIVPEDILEVYQQEPVVLPAWDPLGSLAC